MKHNIGDRVRVLKEATNQGVTPTFVGRVGVIWEIEQNHYIVKFGGKNRWALNDLSCEKVEEEK